jgi:hypothetical protein
MRSAATVVCLGLLLAGAFVVAQVPDQAHWPQWRGPSFNSLNSLAKGDGPTAWSDTSNIKWKAANLKASPVAANGKLYLAT